MSILNGLKLDQKHVFEGNSIFGHLPDVIIQEIEGAKIQNHYNKNQTIHLQGTPFFGISCIHSGMVKRVKGLSNGEETIMALSESGDFFGLNSVLSDSIAIATYSAIALEKTVINFYDKTFFRGMLKKHPQLGINIISKFQKSIENDELRILSLSKKSVRERVAETLINLANKYGKDEENGTRVSLKLSRIELSSLVGTANETLIRTLSDFQREKMIELISGSIVVTDHRKLQYCTGD